MNSPVGVKDVVYVKYEQKGRQWQALLDARKKLVGDKLLITEDDVICVHVH